MILCLTHWNQILQKEEELKLFFQSSLFMRANCSWLHISSETTHWRLSHHYCPKLNFLGKEAVLLYRRWKFNKINYNWVRLLKPDHRNGSFSGLRGSTTQFTKLFILSSSNLNHEMQKPLHLARGAGSIQIHSLVSSSWTCELSGIHRRTWSRFDKTGWRVSRTEDTGCTRSDLGRGLNTFNHSSSFVTY